MVDANTDFFKIVDNFAKTADVPSIPIIEAQLDFVPKVTIAIPTHKRANLLKEAIDSAIKQVGYDEYDIIVVDNNPERGCDTEKLMQSYNHPKLSYYKNSENIQMTGNWNRLFTLAKGEYVIMLHDDDLLLPNFLKECMPFVIKEPDIGILKPLSKSFQSGEQLYYETKKDLKEYKLKRLYDISNYFNFVMGAPTGCLFNKGFVLSIGGFNHDFFPTMDLCFVSIFSTKHKVYTLNEPLSLYRWENNESMKISVLRGFVVNDYYFRLQLLKKYYLPKSFTKRYLRGLIKRKSIMFKGINPNFTFDLNELDLKPISNISANIHISLMRAYSKFIRISKDLQCMLNRS